MSKKISLAEFAELVGATRSAITQAVKNGRLLAIVDAEGRQWLDQDQALLQWGIEKTAFDKDGEPLVAGDGGFEHGKDADGDQIPDIYRSKAKSAYFKAKQDELAFLIKKGKLRDSEEVDRERFADGRLLRNAFQNWPSKLAPILAAETDVKKIERLLDAELRSVLSNVPDEPEKT